MCDYRYSGSDVHDVLGKRKRSSGRRSRCYWPALYKEVCVERITCDLDSEDMAAVDALFALAQQDSRKALKRDTMMPKQVTREQLVSHGHPASHTRTGGHIHQQSELPCSEVRVPEGLDSTHPRRPPRVLPSQAGNLSITSPVDTLFAGQTHLNSAGTPHDIPWATAAGTAPVCGMDAQGIVESPDTQRHFQQHLQFLLLQALSGHKAHPAPQSTQVDTSWPSKLPAPAPLSNVGLSGVSTSSRANPCCLWMPPKSTLPTIASNVNANDLSRVTQGPSGSAVCNERSSVPCLSQLTAPSNYPAACQGKANTSTESCPSIYDNGARHVYISRMIERLSTSTSMAAGNHEGTASGGEEGYRDIEENLNKCKALSSAEGRDLSRESDAGHTDIAVDVDATCTGSDRSTQNTRSNNRSAANKRNSEEISVDGEALPTAGAPVASATGGAELPSSSGFASHRTAGQALKPDLQLSERINSNPYAPAPPIVAPSRQFSLQTGVLVHPLPVPVPSTRSTLAEDQTTVTASVAPPDQPQSHKIYSDSKKDESLQPKHAKTAGTASNSPGDKPKTPASSEHRKAMNPSDTEVTALQHGHQADSVPSLVMQKLSLPAGCAAQSALPAAPSASNPLVLPKLPAPAVHADNPGASGTSRGGQPEAVPAQQQFAVPFPAASQPAGCAASQQFPAIVNIQMPGEAASGGGRLGPSAVKFPSGMGGLVQAHNSQGVRLFIPAPAYGIGGNISPLVASPGALGFVPGCGQLVRHVGSAELQQACSQSQTSSVENAGCSENNSRAKKGGKGVRDKARRKSTSRTAKPAIGHVQSLAGTHIPVQIVAPGQGIEQGPGGLPEGSRVALPAGPLVSGNGGVCWVPRSLSHSQRSNLGSIPNHAGWLPRMSGVPLGLANSLGGTADFVMQDKQSVNNGFGIPWAPGGRLVCVEAGSNGGSGNRNLNSQ